MKLLHHRNVLLFQFSLLLACTLSKEDSTYRKSTVFFYFLGNIGESMDTGFNAKKKNTILLLIQLTWA